MSILRKNSLSPRSRTDRWPGVRLGLHSTTGLGKGEIPPAERPTVELQVEGVHGEDPQIIGGLLVEKQDSHPGYVDRHVPSRRDRHPPAGDDELGDPDRPACTPEVRSARAAHAPDHDDAVAKV